MTLKNPCVDPAFNKISLSQDSVEKSYVVGSPALIIDFGQYHSVTMQTICSSVRYTVNRGLVRAVFVVDTVAGTMRVWSTNTIFIGLQYQIDIGSYLADYPSVTG